MSPTPVINERGTQLVPISNSVPGLAHPNTTHLLPCGAGSSGCRNSEIGLTELRIGLTLRPALHHNPELGEVVNSASHIRFWHSSLCSTLFQVYSVHQVPGLLDASRASGEVFGRVVPCEVMGSLSDFGSDRFGSSPDGGASAG